MENYNLYRPASVGTYAVKYSMNNQFEYKLNPPQGYKSNLPAEDSQVIRPK